MAAARSSRRFKGKVVSAPVARGTKSQHVAMCLDMPDRRLQLRRPGGNPFDDATLQSLLGKTICIEGELLNPTTILVASWYELKPRRKDAKR